LFFDSADHVALFVESLEQSLEDGEYIDLFDADACIFCFTNTDCENCWYGKEKGRCESEEGNVWVMVLNLLDWIDRLPLEPIFFTKMDENDCRDYIRRHDPEF